jgi:Kef-type K+ transport system membrane component KefB/Trk K+ transport system NAD-binding subunit
MDETLSFAPLLLVVFLAFLVPMLLSRLKRFRVPIVVGEIIAGILVGRSGLDWVQGHDPVLDLLGQFGFVFLMFLSGMEINFANLGALGATTESGGRQKRVSSWGPVQLGTATFLLTLTLSVGIGALLVKWGLARNNWMVALILSTTSLGVVLPVLKERGLSGSRYGQTLLIAALIADFATMLLITILVAAVSKGLTLEILLVGILFVAFFLMYRLGMYFFNRLTTLRNLMGELSHATAQIKVRAAFAMMLTFVVLSQVLGAEIILGAFLAGAIVSLLRTPEDEELSPQLEAIGFGFFIPIFFITVGIEFNLKVLLNSPGSLLVVPILLLAAFLVKFIPTLLFRREYGWRETLAAGSLLSARLSLIIAASAIGLRLGIIAESVNAGIILVAILTVTIAPPLFLRILPEHAGDKPKPIIVAGAGELGTNVAYSLLAHHETVILVDDDEERANRARKRGLTALQDHLEQPSVELSEYLDLAKALVCTYADTQKNLQICEYIRKQFGIQQIVAQVNNPNEIPSFEQLGVVTMNAALDRAALLVLLTRNPALYTLLTRTDDDKEVYEVAVKNAQCIGLSLREMSLPGDVLVLALRRNGELIVPHGNTQVEPGDHLTLVGSMDSINFARKWFGAEGEENYSLAS